VSAIGHRHSVAAVGPRFQRRADGLRIGEQATANAKMRYATRHSLIPKPTGGHAEPDSRLAEWDKRCVLRWRHAPIITRQSAKKSREVCWRISFGFTDFFRI
jgi:hypothetical protein